jgi:hypothetical protein
MKIRVAQVFLNFIVILSYLLVEALENQGVICRANIKFHQFGKEPVFRIFLKNTPPIKDCFSVGSHLQTAQLIHKRCNFL